MTMSPDHVGDLRQLLIEQFMLHEVQHHELEAGGFGARKARVPMAHSLIDIYKCLHQGEFGVGHTIDHPESFKQRLYQEITDSTATPDCDRGPAVESVSADGAMLRVHLRALPQLYAHDVKQAVRDLTGVCIESARLTRGSNEQFFETLDRFRILNQAGDIILAEYVFAFPSEWVNHFLTDVRGLTERIGQVPVFSHSETYRRLNRPSYRVVARSVLKASPLACLLEE
jgi:hypothetical protein